MCGSQSVRSKLRCSVFVSISVEPISHAENFVKAVGLYITFCMMVLSTLKFFLIYFCLISGCQGAKSRSQGADRVSFCHFVKILHGISLTEYFIIKTLAFTQNSRRNIWRDCFSALFFQTILCLPLSYLHQRFNKENMLKWNQREIASLRILCFKNVKPIKALHGKLSHNCIT